MQRIHILRKLLAPAPVLFLCSLALAQKATPVVPRSSGGGTSAPSNSPSVMNSPYGPEMNEADARMEELRARSRAEDRRRRMVEDANRLVALTTRYRAAVEDHGRETPEDARLLLDIEKLARSVKDRMRGM